MTILDPKSLPDAERELYIRLLDATKGMTSDLAFQVYLQALQGLGSTAGIVYSESSEPLTFTTGSATLDASTGLNIQSMALTQNSAITVTNGTTIPWKPFTLVVTHTGGPWTLSWDGTDLELTGAAGEREYVLVTYNNVSTTFDVFHGGVVDVII